MSFMFIFLALTANWFIVATCADRKIPVYKIDLDLPPETRWAQIAMEFKFDARNLLIICKKILPLPVLKLAWYLADKLDNLPEEYKQEIQESGTALENLLMAIYTKFHLPVGIEVRRVLEFATSFPDAVKMLSEVHLIAPVYFILAGTKPHEGVVITRDRWKPADIWWLNGTPTQNQAVAIKKLKDLGRANLNAESLFKILSTYPVNNEMTIFSMVMSASTPELYHNMARIRSQ